MKKKNIKTNLLSHSEAKVQLLGKYLKRYLNIISNDGYTEKINIFDLFCGQGEYENGGEGSPLVSLREIKNAYHISIKEKPIKKPKINCYFNDIDEDKIDILENAIKNKFLYDNNIGELELTTNDYIIEIQRLSKLFKTYQNEKGFVFIDPYGYKEVRAEHIKQLMDCNKKAEVLLWLPIQFMYRFSKNETPESLQNFIDELGLTSEIGDLNNVWDFIDLLKKGFQNYLGNNFFVDNFSLKKEENSVFCLYFFTSHIRGFEKMLEAKWDIDSEQGKGWDYGGNQPSLFFEYKTNPLAERLEVFLKEKPRTNGETYEFTLRQGFLPKHANEILADWQQIGKLSVKLTNGKNARKKAFYNSYKYYKSPVDYSKVNFIIK